MEQMFYNAQRDYVEQFVLGIDPRKQEQLRAMSIIQKTAHNESILMTNCNDGTSFKVARFEG